MIEIESVKKTFSGVIDGEIRFIFSTTDFHPFYYWNNWKKAIDNKDFDYEYYDAIVADELDLIIKRR